MKVPRELVGDDLKLEDSSGSSILSMRVQGGFHLPERIWFEGPTSFLSQAAGADPFLPVLMCCGMGRGLPVRLDVPVSKKLYLGAHQVMDTLHQWSVSLKGRLKKVKLTAPLEVRKMTGTNRGAFLSGGVDSISTVLNNRANLDYLIFVHGFDISLNKTAEFSKALKMTEDFCWQEGFKLIHLKTNAQKFTSPPMDWGKYAHGSCIAAAGHVFSKSIREIRVAATYWTGHSIPRGSSPEIDPLWSSEGLSVIHDGFDLTRAQRTEVCARSEAALKMLRVCFQGMGRWNNCGNCEKCLRTMFALACCGSLGKATLFPKAIAPEKVLALRPSSVQIPFWYDNLTLARRTNASRQLVELAKGVISEYEARNGIHA